MVPLGLDRFNEAGFFAPDGQREGVAIMLPKAFAILFALAGVTCWLAPGVIGGPVFSARKPGARLAFLRCGRGPVHDPVAGRPGALARLTQVIAARLSLAVAFCACAAARSA